ncbi:hypothetical protein J5226_19515 [Lysobacter sp. K5869]|uniref:hypothetical protein n=1 Tax=Lysobacter sp. K5869 TaxID=2820808 RepID=UPI001C063528|nr:hypothetical protein [Lysobacter sp. K5869]QWP75776.1 hypothetical protein J5226_19515 [Lysobacter sp. K5869]
MKTAIKISQCDNELYIIASTGAGASEVCHISSGYNDPVAYAVNLNSILPPGKYDLTLVGINWGGPAAFAVDVGGTPYTYKDPNAPVGVVWSKTIQVAL